MLVIIDHREMVTAGYASGFNSEGVAATGFCPDEFRDWVRSVALKDLNAIEGFLLGDCRERETIPRIIRERSDAPVIAMSESQSLEQTLQLFAAGVDDVVRKPVHCREIMARVGAIRRRAETTRDYASYGKMDVYFDGRDPCIDGQVLTLPRRERRILEYLVANRGRRVDKSQIFNAVYGIFDENVDENVIESHVSKLRKKLRAHLGCDPIDSKRYLGYQFD